MGVPDHKGDTAEGKSQAATTAPSDHGAAFGTVRLGLVAAGLAAIFAVMGAMAFRRAPMGWEVLLTGAVLAACLIALSAIDVREQRLPNVLTLGLLGLGLALAATAGWVSLAWHVAAALAGYGAFWVVAAVYRSARGIEGLGGGDAKLLAAGGAWTALEALPTIVLVAAATALLTVGIAHLAGYRSDRNRRVPFGPFLAIGLWYAWLFGPLLAI